MNHTCSHNQDDLILHFYGEMDESDRAEVDVRLLVCEPCKQAYQALLVMEDHIPRTPSAGISEGALNAIRSATSKRIQSARNARRSSYSLIPGFSRPAQWAMVASMVLVAFISGRNAFPTMSTQGNPLESFPSKVSGIEYDPSQGLVEIQYESSTQSVFQGEIRDSRVQYLLGSALMDEENPIGRLSAARVVTESNFLEARPDERLITALQDVLERESNQGIRLQVMKALQSLFIATPVSEELKQQLFGVLLNDPNSAVRIGALDLLTRSELVSLEMKSIFESARNDMNPVIRRKAESVLAQFSTAGRLEEIK